MKFAKNIAVIAALIAVSSAAQAQSYSWLTTTQSSANAGSNQAVNWDWNWNAGGQALSGTLITTRNTGADYTFGSVGSNYNRGAFNNSPYGDSVGGASGIREVQSRPSNGAGPANVVYQYDLSPGTAAPTNTLISITDPGVGVLLQNVVATYTFSATLNGVAVDTSQWTMQVERPYSLIGILPTDFNWNGSTLTASNYSLTAALSLPESEVFLNTNNTRFDSLTITAVSSGGGDVFGIGLGAVTTPVPEPGTALLATLGLLGWFARARLGRARDLA